MAGPDFWQRGFDYFSHGHVDSLEDIGNGVQALVRGTRDYSVTLTNDEGVPDYTCDCPVGVDGAFCKHCVATALAWGARAAGTVKQGARKPKTISLADAGKVLLEEDKEALVTMLLDWAKHDETLRGRLILHAARRSAPDVGVEAVRRAFEKAVRVRGYVGYREAYSWAHDVDDAINSIEQLLNDGHAAATIGLCEWALQALLGAIQAVDDSDGHFSTLRDRLEEIHYRACLEARPNPVDLADRLFRWELNSDFDVFSGAAIQYAKILGDEGLRAYRQQAEAAWAKVPLRTSSERSSTWSGDYRITSIMESLAQASGDIEELVGVLSHDLSSGYSYLRIAKVYGEAKQYDKALEWAEKGLKAFAERVDSRLREFAAGEYHRRGRHNDAVKLIWADFIDRPALGAYTTLADHAGKAKAWPEWRERAVEEIRKRIREAGVKSRGRVAQVWAQSASDHSLLVEIFLHEGKADDAWREAQAGGCEKRLWLRLADIRGEERPEDSGPIYLKYAEAGVDATRNGRYEEPVDLLIQAATAMKRAGQSAEFALRLETLRAKYKIKRNFMKLVEQRRKSLYLA